MAPLADGQFFGGARCRPVRRQLGSLPARLAQPGCQRDPSVQADLGYTHKQLETSYEDLQSTVEELETTNEELSERSDEIASGALAHAVDA